MSMRLAVETALSKLGEQEGATERDIAVKHLARQYATEIDQDEQISVQAAAILREIRPWCDPVLYTRIEAIFAKIERTQVLATLGPKLQSALVELGMTPRSRADVKKKAGVAGNESTDNSPLAKYRAEHAQGKYGA